MTKIAHFSFLFKRKYDIFFNMINILFTGEITGRPGIQCTKVLLDKIKKENDVDYTVSNCEGMTNGFGIGKAHASQLAKMGVNLSCGAEKLFYKIDMVEGITKNPFILRPYNMNPATPGKSFRIVEIKGKKFLIANLIGNSQMNRIASNNAFLSAERLLEKAESENAKLIIFFHAATTAEKNTMLYFLKGKAAAVIGTHTKVLTADAKVLSGTAYISDTGRVGAFYSVSGFESQTEIRKYMRAIPERSHECWSEGRFDGVVVSLDEESGMAVEVKTIAERCDLERPENG